MSTDAFKYKRPFSPDEQTDALLQQWQTPDLTSERLKDDTRTNALNKTQPIAKSRHSHVEEEIVVKPLTADDIEQIRQVAYEEGFSEGKEEGFSKGYAEGREQGQQDGFNQGQAEGKKQGLADGKIQLEQQLKELTQLIDQMQHPLQQVDKQVQQALVDLSLAMAKAIINVEVATNEKVILQAVREATEALPLQSCNVLIKLHPEDMAIVQQHYAEQELISRQWQLRAEPLLDRGGCVVETTQSSVDVTLAQRIQTALSHFIQLHAQNADTANNHNSSEDA